MSQKRYNTEKRERKQLKEKERYWMNHYPRRKLDYSSAFEQSHLASILADACVI